MLWEIALFFVAVFIYIYYEITKQFNFFKDRGIPFDKPSFPFGSKGSKKLLTGEVPFSSLDYETLQGGFENEKVVGFFSLGQPIFIVNDEELAKHILIKDFEYFTDRRSTKTNDKYVNAFLINLEGAEWKQVRSLMTGAFTTGKLKTMAGHMIKVGNSLEEHVNEIATKGTEIDTKFLGTLFTCDTIATSMFGIELNSFKEPENRFRTMALTMVGAPGYTSQLFMIKILFIMMFPRASKILNLSWADPQAVKFFADIISKKYQHRISSGERRNDLIDIIAEELKALKNADSSSQFKESDAETLIISNALLFFFAGFDTSSQVFSLVCHKLVMHPELQERVAEEIDDIFEDGPLTYDKINETKYMDKFINESCRNPIMFESHERLCTKDYKIPGTDIVIPKGRFVHVYVRDIINSKDNFVNPEEFDPENFDAENRPNKFGNQLFGHGPRGCIGMRYAMLTMKIALISVLRRHRIVRGPNYPETVTLNTSNPNIFQDPICVKFEKREK